ncbi:hypothetical protein DY000_02007698 [Brassica cretica]|uniref:Uncharacterized protein n=1 Tax=Brassica cretica TaxID=69181 RepID=A0ABQ7C1L0_BRACR|nr:hypothetical protein DY000_02007698 [Brassica cretica]
MQGTDPNPSPWEKMPPHPPVGYWCAWCYSNPTPHFLTTLLQDELSPIDLVLGSSNVKRTNNLPVDVEAFPPTVRGLNAGVNGEVPDGVRGLLRLPFLASGITRADSRLILKILFP